MIVVTGAAGFIASCLVSRLNAANFNDIVVVDNFSIAKKLPNIEGKKLREYVDRETFFEWLDANHEQVEFVFPPRRPHRHHRDGPGRVRRAQPELLQADVAGLRAV